MRAAAAVIGVVIVAAVVVVSSAAANTRSPSLSYCSGFFHVLLHNLAFSTPSFPHAGLPSSSVGLRLRRLPPSLRSHPFLQEFYGTAEWSARAVYSGRNGWFGGNSNRFPNKKCDEIQINLQATFPSLDCRYKTCGFPIFLRINLKNVYPSFPARRGRSSSFPFAGGRRRPWRRPSKPPRSPLLPPTTSAGASDCWRPWSWGRRRGRRRRRPG